MGKLFSPAQLAQINKVAESSRKLLGTEKKTLKTSATAELAEISKNVEEYFKDSPAICITTQKQLHEYVLACIEAGYAGIDTETTGLDRINDTIVGASLYYPGGTECYIPTKHMVPILDSPYSDQLTYAQIEEEFKLLEQSDIKLIFANADFDLSMIYKDLHVDLCDRCYYDVILAWRCIKEDELHNGLKELYNKYVLKGVGDPKKFSDFFSPQLFPYCKPSIAKLYAANDAKITYELFKWQLPYVTKSSKACKKRHLEAIADLLWGVELPMIKVCQHMHRCGIYVDKNITPQLIDRYKSYENTEKAKLAELVDAELEKVDYSTRIRAPFKSGFDFNPKSPPHVKYLLSKMMKVTKETDGTGKGVLADINTPVTNQILKVRSLGVLISTFVEKLPAATTPDSRIHAQFKQIGADTGRMSSADPNLQNIPSHAVDIRHMFRATPGYVMLSSDYSAQEPRITAYIGNESKMIEAFQQGRDVYASIASAAFDVPYENCLEFHPETHEYQPDGKARRGEAKTILLGLTYGRSIPSIAEQLYGKNKDMSDEEKMKNAQKVFDSVMTAFPGLRSLMLHSQNFARKHGYVETMLGRRRHLPDMTLPEFEFRARPGYVNPDVDPLDPSTLDNQEEIPQRIIDQLTKEFSMYKYFGQIVKRTNELYDENIRVINNRSKIAAATRQCLNSRVQGSAADMTKMAILRLESNEEWKRIGGRLLVPVHDELIAEVPMEYAEEGGKLLSKMMCDAADFLPFPSKCDVETSYRWYGMSYPCPYTKPQSSLNVVESHDSLSEDEIKWIQYCILEMEYLLPVYNDADGNKPIGDAAKGCNGVWSDELADAIKSYCMRRNIQPEKFVDFIWREVDSGTIEESL